MMQLYGEDSRGRYWQSLILVRDESESTDPRKTPGDVIQIILTVILFVDLSYCLYVAQKSQWRNRDGKLDTARDSIYKVSCVALMIGLAFDVLSLALGENSPASKTLTRISAFLYLWAVLFFQGLLFNIVEQQALLTFPVWRHHDVYVLHFIQMTLLVIESFIQFVQYWILSVETVGTYYTGLFPSQSSFGKSSFGFFQAINYTCVALWFIASIDVFFCAFIFAIKNVYPRKCHFAAKLLLLEQHHRLYFLGVATAFIAYAVANLATSLLTYFLNGTHIVHQAMVYVSLITKMAMYTLMIHIGPPTVVTNGGKSAAFAEGEAVEIPDRRESLDPQPSTTSQRNNTATNDDDLDGSTIHIKTETVKSAHDRE